MIKKTALLSAALLVCSATAYAEVAVIVSSKSSTSQMTAEEISRIYLGKSNAMKPIDNGGASPVRAQFYSKVTGKDEAQVKAIWSKLVFTGKATPPKKLSSDSEVIQAVSGDPNAIGYVDKSALTSSVKVIFEGK
jgi:ABC-type phosphate transport system substrate-binding protein